MGTFGTLIDTSKVLYTGAKSLQNLQRAGTTLKRQKSFTQSIKPAYNTYKSFQAFGGAVRDLDEIYTKEHDRSRSRRHSEHHDRPRAHRSHRDPSYDRRSPLRARYYQPRSYASSSHSRPGPFEPTNLYDAPRRARTAYVEPPSNYYYERPADYYYREPQYVYKRRPSTRANPRYY